MAEKQKSPATSGDTKQDTTPKKEQKPKFRAQKKVPPKTAETKPAPAKAPPKAAETKATPPADTTKPAAAEPATGTGKFRRSSKVVRSEVKVNVTPPAAPLDQVEDMSSVSIDDTPAVKNHDDYMQEAKALRIARGNRLAADLTRTQEMMELQRTFDLKAIVTGNIWGVERRRMNNFSSHYTVCAVLEYCGIPVFIPYRDMFCDPAPIRTETEPDVDYDNRLSHLLTNCIGANIRYTIKNIVRDNMHEPIFCIGSRVDASLRDQTRCYIAGANHERPRYMKNDTVDADIIAVGSFGVRVCIGGVDTQIPIHFLSNRFIDNCANYYEPGQKIRVRIISVIPGNRSDGGKGMAILANAKIVEREDLLAKNLHRVRIGATYAARISVIKTNRFKGVPSGVRASAPTSADPEVYLMLESLEVPVIANTTMTTRDKRPLYPGYLVAYTVTGINDKTGQVYGTVRKIISDAPGRP